MRSTSAATSLLLLTCSLGGCGAGFSATPSAAAEPSARAAPTSTPARTAGPTFSSAQADRGRDLFRASCTECHSSGEFSDARFRYRWSRRSAGQLYGLIRATMPETDPGSLTPEESVDLVSWILRMNGFEPGPGELPADRAFLDRIGLASLR